MELLSPTGVVAFISARRFQRQVILIRHHAPCVHLPACLVETGEERPDAAKERGVQEVSEGCPRGLALANVADPAPRQAAAEWPAREWQNPHSTPGSAPVLITPEVNFRHIFYPLGQVRGVVLPGDPNGD
jgi:hypothetical protein